VIGVSQAELWAWARRLGAPIPEDPPRRKVPAEAPREVLVLTGKLPAGAPFKAHQWTESDE
jgi:hypothetical protein